jgi:hypothetical protein
VSEYSTRSRGYAVTVDPDGKTIEEDTITCGHCNVVVFLKPREGPPGGCGMCRALLCEKCTNEGGCTPFEKRLEQWEARDRLLRAAQES